MPAGKEDFINRKNAFSLYDLYGHVHALAQEPLPRVMKFTILVDPSLIIITIYVDPSQGLEKKTF